MVISIALNLVVHYGIQYIRATSSAYNNAFIIWESIGTPILCSESISVRSFIITEKSDGDKIHPCFTPLSLLNHSDSSSARTTLLLTVLYSYFTIAESESDLQAMLNIASSIATTWSLGFNSNKSKVLVV
jgi:hypothetical protein